MKNSAANEALREASRALFEGTRSRSIRAAALRDDPFADPPPRDLDLLVHPDDERTFRGLLEDLGYVTRTPADPGQHKFVAFKALPGLAIHVIDVHLEMVQDGLVYLDARDVLEHRVAADGYDHLSPEDTVLHLVFHELIRRGRIREEKARTIRTLSAGALDLERIDRQLRAVGLAEIWSGEIADRIESLAEQPDACARVGAATVAQLEKRLPARRRFDRDGRLSSLLAKLRFARRGPLIAVVGADGTGKSTFVDLLERTIEETAGLSARTIYLGPWGHYRLLRFYPGGVHEREIPRAGSLSPPPAGEAPVRATVGARLHLKRMLGGTLAPSEAAELDRVARHSEGYWRIFRPYHRLRFLAFLTFLFFEYAVRLYRVRRDQMRGHVVIADRYIDDLLLGSMHHRVRWNARLCRALWRLHPRPDHMVVLLGDPEVILERKQDLDPETMREFLAFYTEVAERPEARMVWSDAPPDELVDRFLRAELPGVVFGSDRSAASDE